MAVLALPTAQTTASQEDQGMFNSGGRKFFLGTIALPTSYNVNGYSIDGMFGFTKGNIETLISGVWVSGGHPLCLVPVITNKTITSFIVFDLSTGAEAVTTFNVGAVPVPVLIVGN